MKQRRRRNSMIDGVRARRLRRAVGAAWLALLASLVASSAQATPEFPAAVDKDLMLTKTVETTFPTQGCRLCHPTESPPASNPPLKPFGEILFGYGTRPDDVASLQAALTLVQQNEPWLLVDLMSGEDPNLDEHQPSSLPTPDYGCSLGAAPVSGGTPWAAGPFGALLVLAPLVRLARRARSAG
jgi:hypothetical protein